jgi:acetyl-CoA carboxylase carboxyltransferase component
MPIVAGLDCRAFALFAQLSGLVPLVGIASGYCFAGNAALLGCCDVVIATEDSSIGMGGPAMIEGGGLGVHEPGAVGPIDVQHANGVVDLRARDDAGAVALAKRYLSYFTAPYGTGESPTVPDQALLRELIPEQRKRVYDVRRVVAGLFDESSVLELRDGFAAGMLTALARVDGRALGVVANDPRHLGGAIDADGADKAARFLQLCDAFELPVLFLCDTPGFMVGPDAERTATVRHFARMFLGGANVSVATGTIVLRKGYGLGAQAMAGGGFKAPLFTVGWPTSEFGGMGLEGAVRLGMRRELDAIDDEAERELLFQQLVAGAYEHGRGVNMAAYGEIDDVIDPADSRRWIATLFDERSGAWRARPGKKRPMIDAW